MSRRRIFLALLLLVAPSGLHAQSFNCSHAATPVEKLICATDALKTLDTSLDEKVQKALNASLAERAKLQGEERAWLSERDKKCAIPAGASGTDQSASGAACLEAAYRDRIAAIEALIKRQEAARTPDRAVCQRIVDSYKSLIAADPKAFFEKDADKAGMAANPLTALEAARNAGFTRAKPVAEFSDASSAQVDRWAKKQKPAFNIPKKLMDAIFEDEPHMLTIDRAPGTNYYAASSVQGTAHCVYATYFEVKDGVALRAGAPSFGEGACGVEQFFGTIDGRTVAIEDNDSRYQPTIGDTLTIMAWDKDFFRAPCMIDFEFEPVFSDGANDNAEAPEEKCDSAICKALQPQARALAEAAQRDPLEARKAAIARVTAGQRAAFERMEKLAPKDQYGEPLKPEEAANPAMYREDGPLLAPLIHDGEVYLASVGHTTMGWRTFADWSVKLDRLDGDALKRVGMVYVNMAPGKLRKAAVR